MKIATGINLAQSYDINYACRYHIRRNLPFMRTLEISVF